MATSLPNEKPGNLICIGIPTKNGLWSYRVGLSLSELVTPINCSLMKFIVAGKPVDEARNHIVEMAQDAGAKYLLFMDDDNILPPFTIPRLLNLKAKVASGVYYTKYQPPTPVILKKDIVGGYEKWNYGDVVEVDYIGLGCALIDMSIFNEIEKPYFKYVKYGIDPRKGEPHIGEDVYFCNKVTEKGYKIYADTYVQCGHVDVANETIYFFLESAHCGAWMDKTGKIQYLPPADKHVATDKHPNAVSTPNLSWGYGDLASFVDSKTIDLLEIKDKFKDVENVKINHVAEFKTPEEILALLHCVLTIMKLGGSLEMRVPNAIKKVRSLTDTDDENFVDKFTGSPNGRYKSYYTKKNLEQFATLLNLKESTVVEDGDELVLSGKNG